MIGEMKQIILEKWTQAKQASGVLSDTMGPRYKVYAEVKRSSSSKLYDRQQSSDITYSFKIWYNGNLNLNCLWKVVYDGKRINVQSIEQVNETRFNWLLKAEVNGSKN